MKTHSQRNNWIIDVVLFAGFFLSFLLDFTGVAWHQWLGIALSALAVYHLWAHWTWACSVAQRLAAHTSTRARLCWLVDAGLLSGFVIIATSGLVISSWLDLPLFYYDLWRDFHVIISVTTMILVVVKVGLHWRWIVNIFSTRISPLRSSTPKKPATRPAASATTTRREFLGLMGMVSLAAVAVIIHALDEQEATSSATDQPENIDLVVLPAPENTRRVVSTPEATSQATTTSETAGQPIPASEGAEPAPPTAVMPPENEGAASCTVQCSRGCAYPGHCRRYRDANENGYCDLGECL